MDELAWKENDAFSWIQRTAMRERVPMKQIALRIINDGLRPQETEKP